MIPVFDNTRQNKILKKELNWAIQSVIESGRFILGPKVEEFEREFARYIGTRYAVGVASGTDAISLALLAVGVGMGDEIIMPANAYPSVFAVTTIGVIPKLVDIDAVTFNIDPVKIPAAITKKTKAIMPVHIYGQPADMEKILDTGKKYKIPIVEDCAQAHGAECLGKKVGRIGDIGCFSFYPTKNLGCFGDGGMVVTNNEEIYKKLKLLRMYGEESRYNSVLLGRNSRLDELQAAILLIKLKYLDKWIERRREIAALYLSYFTGPAARVSQRYDTSPVGIPSLVSPVPKSNVKHVYHLFVIRTKKRDKLKKYLEEKRVQTAIHYPTPIHLAHSMKYLGYKRGDFPQTERAVEEILSLPMFPELTDNEVKLVCEGMNEFFS